MRDWGGAYSIWQRTKKKQKPKSGSLSETCHYKDRRQMRIHSQYENSLIWDVPHSFQSYVNIWIAFSMAESELLSLMQNLLNETLWPVLNKRLESPNAPCGCKIYEHMNLWDWSLLLRSQTLAGCLARGEECIT